MQKLLKSKWLVLSTFYLFIITSLLLQSGCRRGVGGYTPPSTDANSTLVANAGPDQNVLTGSVVTLDGSGSSDANGDILTYSWSVTSQPEGSSATLSNAAVVNPTFTADKDGIYVLSLTVNDGLVNSATDTVVITAATGNVAPVANAGPDQNVLTGSVVTLDGSGSSDANGDILTYSWSFTSQPEGSTATLSNATVVNPAFTADMDGAYVLSLTVNDGLLNSATDTVVITAATGNVAPVANAGPDQNVLTGSVVTLNGSGSSDANGDILTYSWSFTSKPAGSTATLSNATVVNPTFTADKDGAYVLSLTVNDGLLNSSGDKVVITAATGNVAPVANAGPDQNVLTGSVVTLNGSGSSDANGDILTYSWSFTSKPAGSAATLSNATVVNPTFTADKDGSYVLSLTVNDGLLNSSGDTVVITAATGNVAPVANAGPDQNVLTGSVVTLNGSGSSDANGDILTYSWSFTSKPAGSTATLSNATVVNPTFTADKDGAYVLSLTVNDGLLNSTADTIVITAFGVGGTITGRVINAAGTTTSDIIYADLYTGSDSFVTYQSADLNGNYTFSGLASGTYKVMFSESGYADVWYNGATDQSTATLVTVTLPNTTGGIDGIMGVGGTISGHVTDATGTAMSDVSVDLYTGSDSFVTYQSTDSSGSYTFSGLATGTYKAVFSQPGYADVWYNGATSQSTATLVTVTSPNTTSGIDGVMGVGGAISGHVTNAAGTALIDVNIDLYTGADISVTYQSTDSNGDYTISGLASGTYKVLFSASGYADLWYNGATSQSLATLVTVTSPNTTSGIDGVMR